jgi:hypothetical protein
MKVSQLKVGDRIRLLDVPGKGRPGYYMHSETRRVYKRLLARKRPVRISKIDETGLPWFECRFRRKNGRLEYHSLIVADDDNNWVKVR